MKINSHTLFKSFKTANLFFLIILFPCLGQLFGDGSLSLGLFAIVFLIIAFSIKNINEIKINSTKMLIISILLAVVLMNIVSTYFININYNINKSIESLILFSYLLVGALFLSFNLERINNKELLFSLNILFWILTTCALVGKINPNVIFKNNDKPILFFSEPSIFFLNYSPILLFTTITSKGYYQLIIVTISACLILLYNSLTFFLILSGICLLFLGNYRLKLILGIIILAVTFFIFKTGQYTYYFERLNIEYDTKNISLLAFLDAWQRAYLNLKNTYFCGVGFQQLGYHDSTGNIRNQLKFLGYGDLNNFDSSVTASKLISELGAVGILLFGLIIKESIKAATSITRFIAKTAYLSNYELLYYCYIYIFIIDMLFKGLGYFSSNVFIIISFALVSKNTSNSHETNK